MVTFIGECCCENPISCCRYFTDMWDRESDGDRRENVNYERLFRHDIMIGVGGSGEGAGGHRVSERKVGWVFGSFLKRIKITRSEHSITLALCIVLETENSPDHSQAQQSQDFRCQL